jgi:hypothetical protein
MQSAEFMLGKPTSELTIGPIRPICPIVSEQGKKWASRRAIAATLALASTAVFLPPPAARAIIAPEYPCGDCDRDGTIEIAEVVICANVAAGIQPPASCPPCDVDGDGEVTESEVEAIGGIIPPSCPPVIIDVGSAGRDVNDKAVVPVHLSSGRFAVGGTQNDFVFDNTVLALPSVARCRINTAIDTQDLSCQNDPNEITAPCKNLVASLDDCGGVPQPDGCPDGAGTNLTRLRALVTSLEVPAFNPIPNGLLYECEFDVLDPGGLPTVLDITEVVASRPRGGQILDVIGSDGEITGEPPPTPAGPTATSTPQPPTATPSLSRTPTITPTGTPPPTPAGFHIVVGSAGRDAESQAVIPVSLVAGVTAAVGGTQNDVLFDNTIVTLPSVARCRINPDIGTDHEECFLDPEEITLPCKTLGRSLRQCGTSPQPDGCPAGAGENISRLRAIIAPTAVQTTNPVPPGLLYTCTFDVLDPERLPAALVAGNPVVSSPFGMKLFPVEAISGAVTDATPGPPKTPSVPPSASPTGTPSATHTPAATASSTPSATPSSTPSSTPSLTPTATASATASETPTPTAADSPTPTATVVPCDGDCDGSDSVTVDEITRLVNLALGNAPVSECPAGDADGSETITVDELVTAVTRALNGCL